MASNLRISLKWHVTHLAAPFCIKKLKNYQHFLSLAKCWKISLLFPSENFVCLKIFIQFSQRHVWSNVYISPEVCCCRLCKPPLTSTEFGWRRHTLIIRIEISRYRKVRRSEAVSENEVISGALLLPLLNAPKSKSWPYQGKTKELRFWPKKTALLFVGIIKKLKKKSIFLGPALVAK